MFWQFLKPHILHKYKKDQLGIIHRFVQENEYWRGHLQNTQKFILENLPKQGNLKIAVLGSGWLLDFPMNELQQEHELFLFDICHPPQIKNKYRRFSNIHFIDKDLTFGLVDFAHKNQNPDLVLSEADKKETSTEFSSFDATISLNLLNQLDILLIENCFSPPTLNSLDFTPLRKQIQDLHIRSLPKGRSILISDWTELNATINELHPIEKSLIFTQLLNGYPYQEWLWVFDTHKTYHQKNITTFKVRALTF